METDLQSVLRAGLLILPDPRIEEPARLDGRGRVVRYNPNADHRARAHEIAKILTGTKAPDVPADGA